jgi:hypothetical protein
MKRKDEPQTRASSNSRENSTRPGWRSELDARDDTGVEEVVM